MWCALTYSLTHCLCVMYVCSIYIWPSVYYEYIFTEVCEGNWEICNYISLFVRSLTSGLFGHENREINRIECTTSKQLLGYNLVQTRSQLEIQELRF